MAPQQKQLDWRQLQELKKLVVSYADIFSLHHFDIGLTDVVMHCIKTGTASPVCKQPYHVPHYYKQLLSGYVDKMLKAGVIRPSHTPYASPVVFIPKGEGKFRFVIDYRALNADSIFDAYLMRCLDKILD